MNIIFNTSVACKGLRASGLSKSEAHHILNVVQKWFKCSGPEWTNDRLKSIKHWYETYLAGDPQIPPWVRKTKTGTPVGVFGSVFKCKNPAKAFAVLSVNTAIISREPTPSAIEKLDSALGAGPVLGDPKAKSRLQAYLNERIPAYTLDGDGDSPVYCSRWDYVLWDPWTTYGRTRFDPITPPTTADITGTSIPCVHTPSHMTLSFGTLRDKRNYVINDGSYNSKLAGLLESYMGMPYQTVTFLERTGNNHLIPRGAQYRLTREVGTLGCIPQPGLKFRFVANTNRVAQHYLKPFGDVLYRTLKKVPSDCTFDQEAGVKWVQDKLRSGISLSGADMSSATDLLDLEVSLALVGWAYFHVPLPFKEEDYFQPLDPDDTDYMWDDGEFASQFQEYAHYFIDISRGDWYSPNHEGFVTWTRGQPLGTHPSFALLALTNNWLGVQAALSSGLPPRDSFRVIGDDIIMDSRMLNEYTKGVEALGGKINVEKTLTSDRISEFAGRIITPTRSFLKTVKFKEVSDSSFMSVVSNLGPQAISILRPRQRKVYDKLKYIPGIVVPGPYSKESYGEPLASRYFWYLDQIDTERDETDRLRSDIRKEYLDLQSISYSPEYAMRYMGIDISTVLPNIHPDDLDYYSDLLFHSKIEPVRSGDPRLIAGKTTLQWGESLIKSRNFLDYEVFKELYRHELTRSSDEQVSHREDKPSEVAQRESKDSYEPSL